MPGVDYFASPVTLGPNGIDKIHDVGTLSAFEADLMEGSVVPELKAAIEKGIEFVASTK